MSDYEVYHRFNAPGHPGLVCGPGLTQSEHAVECDINHIMDKYTRTGTVATRTDMGRFGDFSDGVDFHEAQNVIVKARDQFSALASRVRAKFDNDPAKFLDWVHAKERVAKDFEDIGMDMSAEYRSKAAAKAVPPVAPEAPK